MITIHRSQTRGTTRTSWLDSRHAFSFADFVDPDRMGFRTLRVVNEDRVAPASGFDSHGHRSMEILTCVVEGAIEHRDSEGNGSVLRAGDVQVMSAGRGIVHSEHNPSRDEALWLLQIWILPAEAGGEARWEERHFGLDPAKQELRLIASREARDGSLQIRQEADVYASRLEAGGRIDHRLGSGRGAWLQLVRGHLALGEHELGPGDAVSVSDEPLLSLSAVDASELLIFDLA